MDKHIATNDTQSILKKNRVTLVPAPWGSKKNDVFVKYNYLPEMLERVFNNCLVLEDDPNIKDRDIAVYHICLDYVRAVFSLEDYTLYNDDELHVSTSIRIAAGHIKKLGIDPQKLCEDAKKEIKRLNKEFFKASTENGEQIILSRGVVLKAMRDGNIPDLIYAIDGNLQGDFVKFEYYNSKTRKEYIGYMLAEGKNDRQAIDFSLMKYGDQFFEEYLDENDIEKIGKKTSSNIAEEMFVMDDIYDQVPTLKR